MKIIIYVADLNRESNPFYKYLSLKELGRKLGYKVIGLSHTPRYIPGIKDLPLYVRFMEKIGFPLDMVNINKKIILYAKKYNPNIIIIEKGLTIRSKTLLKIKEINKDIKLVCYCVDNMEKRFNNSIYFKSCIKYYDLIFISRGYSKKFYYSLGAKKVIYVDKGYCDNFIYKRKKNHPYLYDISFIGTYEKPRYEYIKYISDRGINVFVWGNGWKHILSTDTLHVMGKPVYGKEYVEKMHSSKIILHFLRKANNDLTDSRTYEIPGSDSFMLAERNKEHLRLFKENKEAVFFDSKEELLEKIKYYLKHEKEREKIAEAGYRRCISSGYSYKDRLKYMLNKIEKF